MLTQCLFLKSLICNTSLTSLSIETTTKVISPPGSPLASPASDRTGNLNSPAHSQRTSPEFSSKASRVETVIKRTSSHLDYSNTVSNCVLKYLKENKKEALIYMNQCFGLLLEDDNFLKWLAKSVSYKPYLLKNHLSKKTRKDRTCSVNHQKIYNFCLQNSIISNDSANSSKRITKMKFLKNYKNIVDSEVRWTSVSLTTFYSMKPFYCLNPSEKEKQSCLCINCLNPHVILKSINCYRLIKKLTPHDSLTTYFKKMSSGKTFEKMKIKKECKYYEYRRVVESYIGKNGKRIECTRTARVDLSEPFFKLFEKLRELGDNYLKHRTNLNNISSVFPILKEHYDGKDIELDFSQNLSLRPKDEVQSAHFCRKQFTLHCTIAEPDPYRYHVHINDYTKHDPLFVDYVVRDIIEKYGIRDEGLWIQSDNVPSQYKNRHAFRFYQKLADEFNLRIIRTYGAAGHGKGVTDAMSSFGSKNILRHDTVTLNVFSNSSGIIVDYLAKRRPQFSFTNVPADKVALQRFKLKQDPLEIEDCMKQHLFIFEKGKDVLLKEHLCICAIAITVLTSNLNAVRKVRMRRALRLSSIMTYLQMKMKN